MLRHALAVAASATVTAPFAPALLQDAGTQSRPFGYTFVEAAAFLTDLDELDDDAEGFVLRGSYALDHQFYVFGSAATAEADVSGGGEVDVDSFELGAGLRTPVGESTDFFAQLAYVHAELDGGGFEDSDDGWSVGAGIRHWLLERLELDGTVAYVDVDDGEVGFGAGARFYFTDRVSLGASAAFLDDSETYTLGVRLQF
jgi:hypothetical protein